jgi:hypothetical protein
MAHSARFALGWKRMGDLKSEKVTVILSPHLDDIFLSLYATMLSGKLGKNIIGITFFTSTDSSIRTKAETDFSTIAETSVMRMEEELSLSRILAKKGINYLPVFLGLKDAAIENYYMFIAGGALGKLPGGAVKDTAMGVYRKMVADEAIKLDAKSMLAPLFSQFKQNITRVLAPMGVGTHLDHNVVSQAAIEFGGSAQKGVYAEIPYVSMTDKLSVEKLRPGLPKDFTDVMVTKFDAREKDLLLKKLYSSQYERRTKDAIFASQSLGEVIFWKKQK